MENPEMSLNAHANAVGGIASMDVNKKALMSDQSKLESGYVSNLSISQVGHSQSSKCSSSSFKRSLDLETISENPELKGWYKMSVFFSHLYPNSAMKRSIQLKITTNIETNTELFTCTVELQETPTTRNIRYLNDFHINTPQN